MIYLFLLDTLRIFYDLRQWKVLRSFYDLHL